MGRRSSRESSRLMLPRDAASAAIAPRAIAVHSEGSAAASASAAEEHADAARVYRPLLFQTKGYASSELFRDAWEMRLRMTPSRQDKRGDDGEDDDGSDQEQAPRRSQPQPRIRLETLSSTAAMGVLWITYLTFCFALVLPYLQSRGYLATTTELSGNVCRWYMPAGSMVPCIHVDPAKDTAKWSAVVHNVSWYAGAIQVRVRIQDVLNGSTILEQRSAMTENQTIPDLEVVDESYALHYDVHLYAFDLHPTPTKKWITSEYNRSVWIECPRLEACNTVKLLDISQEYEGVNGSGFGSYWVMVVFKGMYPNRIGRHVLYDFSYTKPAIHLGEFLARTAFLATTILALPCWVISVINFHGAWRDVLPVHQWVLALGVVLLLWQNPVAAVAEWSGRASQRTRFVSETCEAFAQAFFFVIWLRLLDYEQSRKVVARKFLFGIGMFAIDMAMAIMRMPSLFTDDRATRWFIATRRAELYTLLGFFRLALLLVWLAWMVHLAMSTSKYLRTLPYMWSRFQQLSYRFLFLESLLMSIYLVAVGLLQLVALLQSWSRLGYDAFLQDSMHTFVRVSTGNPSLGKFCFISIYVYLVMFVHLPPSAGDSSGFLTSTKFHVADCPHVDAHGFLMPDAHLFCLETARVMFELAYQAYYDPPGQPSPSGYGVIELESLGYELVAQVCDVSSDTYGLVAVSAAQNRLVVAFRGTTSKQNWKSNLRCHQEVLWIKSMGRLRRSKTCCDRIKELVGKIPVANMALPRVHSGFWRAYASVRDQLREVLHLVLAENPGVEIFLVGHSMGGSLAILAAYDLAVNLSMQVQMYNFGGPRTGNPGFAREYNRCVRASYRVVMDGDIVPGLPDFWGLYQHVGTEIAVDVEGNLIVDPSVVEKKLHVSSNRKFATHLTHVYRTSLTKCWENLQMA